MDGSGSEESDIGAAVSDDALGDIVRAMGDVLLVLDTDGTVQATIENGPPTLGYQQESLVGRSITSVLASTVPPVPGFDITAAGDLLTAIEEHDGDTLTVPFEAADGTIVPIDLSVIHRADEYICVGRERPGYLSDTQIELLDTVADPVFVLDGENRVQHVNDAMVECTGYDRADIGGREMSEIIPARTYEKITRKLTSLAEECDCESKTVEAEIITDEGELILTEAHLSTLTDESGAYAGAIGVLRDIRERKQHQRNLELLKQLLTRVFRHNIRNELMIIETHAELLDEKLDGELQTRSEAILDSTDRLLDHSEKARLIEQVIESKELYELDLSVIVEEAVESAERRWPDARIDVELPPEWLVESHPDIKKAIDELVQNAIEHAPGRPQLRIWIDREESGETLFLEDESGGLAPEEIQVLRSGTEEKLKHGSGVGLWLVRLLVEFSEGELIVHRTGDGTVVGIRFEQNEGRSGIEETPVTRAPEQIRESSPDRFRGDTVIGRTEVLEELDDIYDELERKGGHTVLVTGEAGIGKTTLVEQFRERLAKREDSAVIATGYCNETIQPPYYAFRQILREIPGDDDILENVPSVETPEELPENKKALFDKVADQLRSVAADQPVLLIVEDMQWADQGTVALFEHLVEEVGRWSHQILFLGTYRTSDVDETAPVLEIADETAAAGRGTVLELEPLDRTEVESLLSYMLDVDDVPSSFGAEFYDHTGGIPLFVQELGRHLSETVGPVVEPGDLPDDLAAITVPETAERAITDRLEGLPEQVRLVLRLGAIIGREFSFDVLREASQRPVDTLIDCIDTLVDRQLWSRSGDRLEFAHGIVREQTLASIDDDTRTRLHERVAAAIERVHADEIEEYAAQLGHHYEQIGADETAFEYYRQAGAFASDQYANEEAINNYERALSLAADHEVSTQKTVATLQLELGDTFELVGRYDRATECYEDGLELYQRINDRDGEATCLGALGEIARRRGAYDRSQKLLEQSIEIKRETGDRSGEAESLKNLGNIALQQSEFELAGEYYEQSLEIVREIGDRHGQAKCLNNLGIVAHRRDEYTEAKAYYKESLDLSREMGNRESMLYILNHLGAVTFRQGSYEQSKKYHKQALEIAREIGDRYGKAAALDNLGWEACVQGAYSQAREHLEECLAIKREIGDKNGEIVTLSNLAALAIRQGKYEQCRARSDESLEILEKLGNRDARAKNLCTLAMSAVQQGRYERADELATKAHRIGEKMDRNHENINSLCLLARVARKRGEYDTAMEYLRKSRSIGDPQANEHLHARINIEQGRLELARENFESAREAVARAEEIDSDQDLAHQQAHISNLRGRIAAATGSRDEAIDYWQRALDRFQEIGAPQETLKTVQYLIEHDEDTQQWIEKATAIFEDAPDPVKGQHRDWLSEHAAEIDPDG